MFNEGRYTERVAEGELKLEVVRARPAPTDIQNYIDGTESQEVHIKDQDGNLLAKAHRYFRPDGEIAASGLIDPKRMLINGEIFSLQGNHPEDGHGA